MARSDWVHEPCPFNHDAAPTKGARQAYQVRQKQEKPRNIAKTPHQPHMTF